VFALQGAFVVNAARRQFVLGILKVLNLTFMVLSFGLATILHVWRQGGGVPLSSFLSMRVSLANFVVFAFFLVIWHLTLSLTGQYQSQRLATKRSIFMDAVKATTLSTLFLAAVMLALHITLATPGFIVAFWIFTSVSVAGGRLLIRVLLENIRAHGRNLRHVLILGTNKRARNFGQRLEAKPELGYRVLGFVDDPWPGQQEFIQQGYVLCCSFDKLADYLRRNVVDEVAIYLPLGSFYEYSSRVASLCERHGILVRFESDIFNLKVAQSRTDELDGDAHITAHSVSPDGWPSMVKRGLDVTISFIALAILSPLLAAVALAIKVTSKGPVLFMQERVGLNKRRFLIYKFRTMVPNADKLLPYLEKLNEVAGPVFKIKNDPRMTPIGRLLRRASIDELPQLFNVLQGDMSLVGPRPLPVRDYEGFNEDWQRRRFSVRPGITCLWQVNGRSSISFEKWMQLDLEYIDQWSLWLDIKILARTVPAVLKGSGAA
jgi:exopolysaccharide biosynthesis polyprenyl glycosylphosphotransferase